jgi:hypothetical protein
VWRSAPRKVWSDRTEAAVLPDCATDGPLGAPGGAKYHDRRHRRALPTLKPGGKVLVHVSVLGVNAVRLAGVKASDAKRKSKRSGRFTCCHTPLRTSTRLTFPEARGCT